MFLAAFSLRKTHSNLGKYILNLFEIQKMHLRALEQWIGPVFQIENNAFKRKKNLVFLLKVGF